MTTSGITQMLISSDNDWILIDCASGIVRRGPRVLCVGFDVVANIKMIRHEPRVLSVGFDSVADVKMIRHEPRVPIMGPDPRERQG